MSQKTGNFRKITNEETGATEYNLDAKLISVGKTVLTNKNGKNYKIANIEFDHPSRGTMVASAQLFEKSEAHGVETGQVYLTNMSTDGEKTYFRMSHLIAGAGLADASVFDEVEVAVDTEVEVEA